MYENGMGVPKDMNKAVNLYQAAAEKGDIRANVNLGLCCKKGNGVARDFKKAAKFYTVAANTGDPEANYNLGVVYINGNGVAKELLHNCVRGRFTWSNGLSRCSRRPEMISQKKAIEGFSNTQEIQKVGDGAESTPGGTMGPS